MKEVATKLLNSRKAWMVGFIVFICFCVNEMSEQRVPPVLPLITEDMNLSVSEGGWLQSMFGWASLIAALPAGWFLAKLGPKKAMAISVAFCCVSGVIGGLTESYIVLLVARFLSGFGVGLVAVIAATVVDEWFTPEKRGLPNAILIAFYPIACIFMLNSSAGIAEAFSWHGVWWLGAILCAVVVVVVLFLLPDRKPYSELHHGEENQDAKPKEPMKISVLVKNRSLWFIVIAFMCFDIAYVGLMTYAPSMMMDNLGVPLETANQITSTLNIVNMFVVVVNGWLLNKLSIKNRKFLPAIGLAGLGVGAFLCFNATTAMMAICFMVIAGVFTSFISSSLFTIGPDTNPNPLYLGAIVAIVTFGQNLGVAIGPLFVGAIVEAAGNVWTAAALPVLITGLIGAVFCLFIKVKPQDKLQGNDSREALES